MTRKYLPAVKIGSSDLASSSSPGFDPFRCDAIECKAKLLQDLLYLYQKRVSGTECLHQH